VSILEEESSLWTLSALISVPDRGAVLAIDAFLVVHIPILIVATSVRHTPISIGVPCSWVVTSDTCSILDIGSPRWTDTFQQVHIEDKSGGT
jgi:hypothetical protein